MRQVPVILICILDYLRHERRFYVLMGAVMVVAAATAMSAKQAPSSAPALAVGNSAAPSTGGIATTSTNLVKMPGVGQGALGAVRTDGSFPANFEPANLALAKPFFFRGSGSDREMAVNCLSAVAWYEAGNDDAGQRAVIQVVLNRLKHPSFPKSVCAVVFQGAQRRTGCQFTFTCDGSLARRVPSERAWALARGRAEAALDGAVDPAVMQATHYHADYVVPWWSSQLLALSKIGAHIFYRWPGAQGGLSGHPVARLDGDLALESKALGSARSLADSAQFKSGPNPAAGPFTAAGAELVQLRDAGSAPAARPGALFLTVNVGEPSGRWAMAALNRCAGRKDCLAVGYGGGAIDLEAQAASFAQRERPLFLFVRDSISGTDLALWDCNRVPRPNAKQCLPEGRQELSSLMKPRLI
jgi:hypothetical protein